MYPILFSLSIPHSSDTAITQVLSFWVSLSRIDGLYSIEQKGMIFICLFSSFPFQALSSHWLLACNPPLMLFFVSHLLYFQARTYMWPCPLLQNWWDCLLIISQITPSAFCVLQQGKLMLKILFTIGYEWTAYHVDHHSLIVAQYLVIWPYLICCICLWLSCPIERTQCSVLA